MRNIICTEWRCAGAFPHEDGGQSLGKLVFNYTLYPFSKNETSLIAERISAPVKTVQTSKGRGTGADTATMLEIPEELVLTAMKKAEDSDKYIIRIFNPTAKTVKGAIKTTFKNAKLVNLNEEQEGEINLDKIEVGAYKIITIEVEK